VRQGLCVWVSAEEHHDDIARRLLKYEAEPTSVDLASPFEIRHLGVEKLVRRIRDRRPVLVVLDTLHSYATLIHGEAPKSGDGSGWAAVMAPWVELAHSDGPGVVIAHHAGKDGGIRDSTAIAASADMLTMFETEPKSKDARRRRVSHLGRFPVEEVVIALGEDGYALNSSHLPLPDRVVAYVSGNPGTSVNQVCFAVAGNKMKARETIDDLIEKGVLRDEGGVNRRSLYLAKPLPGTAKTTVSELGDFLMELDWTPKEPAIKPLPGSRLSETDVVSRSSNCNGGAGADDMVA